MGNEQTYDDLVERIFDSNYITDPSRVFQDVLENMYDKYPKEVLQSLMK